MFDLFRVKEDAELFQFFYDDRVRLEHVHSGKERHVIGEFAFFIYRRIDVEAIFETGYIVFFPVARSDVDDPGAHVLGHVFGEDHLRRPVDEGVLEGKLLERVGRDFPQGPVVAQARLGHDIIHEFLYKM